MLNQKKTFWELFTQNYLLILRDEINFEKLRTFRFNVAKLVVLLTGVCVLIFIPAYFIAQFFVQLRLETSDSPQARLFQLMEKTDSLEEVLNQQHAYFTNLQQIMKGEPIKETIREDSSETPINTADIDLTELDSIDIAFRKEFEAEDSKTKLLKTSKSELQHVLFFAPVSGIVVNPYKPSGAHFGVDIVAPKNEVIKAAADGTVILASWTQDSGNTIAIQHKHQLVSFYKHNSVLLKKVGEIVKAGDPIAVIGNSGELTDGPHLHFELWYEGNPVNPQDFVSF